MNIRGGMQRSVLVGISEAEGPQVAVSSIERKKGAASQFRLTHGVINRAIRFADTMVILAFAPVLHSLIQWYNDGVGFGAVAVVIAIDIACLAVLMDNCNAYRFENYRRLVWQIMFCVVLSAISCAISVAALAAILPNHVVTWRWPAIFVGYQASALIVIRLAAFAVAGAIMRRGLLQRRTIVIGSADDCATMLLHLSKPALAEIYNPVCVLVRTGDAPSQNILGVPVCGTVRDLPKLATSHEIDMVIVTLPWDRTAELEEVAQLCAYVGADVIMPCRLGFQMPERAKMMELGTMPSLVIASRPLKGTKALAKMTEDYVLAALLLVLLSPIMTLAALAIRLTSPGPVLYRQTRTGLNHATFTIFKFRTMRFDPHDDPTRGTLANDPRVTWVGNLLRRTSLDELPQLLNVLRGEMSLVGPRPYAVGMLVGNEEIAKTARYFAARYKIKPGLTGLAQVHGLRSNALRSRENARLSIELDLQYVESWSLWLDIKIMMRTAIFGMAGKHIF